MAYDVRLTAAADSGLETSGGEPAQSSSSLAEALEQAERMAARPGPAEAVVYDVPEGAGGGSAGTEIARYSAGGGWTSEAITPASWWAGLSQPTKEKLKSDPYGEVPPEVWDELAAAGGVVLGISRPGPDRGPGGLKLPQELADFIDSERPRL